MNLKKCDNKAHKEVIYTLKESCPQCLSKTIEAHYKFIKIKNSPKEFP